MPMLRDRRAPCHHGHCARSDDSPRRRRAAEDALWLVHVLALGRTRDDRRLAKSATIANMPCTFPKSQLVRIIQPARRGNPRTRARSSESGGLCGAGRPTSDPDWRRRQLTGLPEEARRIVSSQVRIGRPLGIQGLPESAKSPAFSTAVGLLIYPQVAGIEHFEPRRHSAARVTGTDGYVSRVGRWLRESF